VVTPTRSVFCVESDALAAGPSVWVPIEDTLSQCQADQHIGGQQHAENGGKSGRRLVPRLSFVMVKFVASCTKPAELK